MHIFATGLSGMVGSRIREVLDGEYSFEDLSSPVLTDLVDYEAVARRVEGSDANYVLHLAAKADLDSCEKDKDTDKTTLGNDGILVNDILSVEKITADKWKGSNSAFGVNVVGTKNIAQACRKTGKKLIHISTDYVFDGNSRDPYAEESIPSPANYYGLTKLWAEQVVQTIIPEALIVRIAFPYGSTGSSKPDIVSRFCQLFEEKKEITATDDQLITPTFIDDIALSLKTLISSEAMGIYHVVGSSTVSPYDFALAIADSFDYDKQLLKKVGYKEYYKERAPRPQFLTVSNDKIRVLGISPRTISEGLNELRSKK